MLNFKEWFVINEGKEEKALAAELAGDALTDLSTVIPQGKNNTDKLLLLAAYYYSKTKNKEQIKTDMTAYIGYLNKNRMPLITVDLGSKQPSRPWDDYIHWVQVIHIHQGEDEAQNQSGSNPSDMDLQNEKPISTSTGSTGFLFWKKSLDGKIKVYKTNNRDQCVLLGKGQSFCISKPKNVMWQSYRDNQSSTFYFVYDDTRNDRLSIVVIDARPNEIVLTDKVNTTGTTLDPYTGQLTEDPASYMKYLKEKGIDLSKITSTPKSPEERKELEELGENKTSLNWFKSLSYDYKSKYIGRGHFLTNEQFDYLWENKFTSLLTQYVKTGLLLSDHQIDKIATNRDLRDKYTHNRLIAVENISDLTNKEYDILNPKQKETFLEKIIVQKKILTDTQFDYLWEKNLNSLLTQYVKTGLSLSDHQVDKIATNNDLKKSYVQSRIIDNQNSGTLRTKEYSLFDAKDKENYYKNIISDQKLNKAIAFEDFDLAKYFLEKKGLRMDSDTVNYAARSGDLDFVKYIVGKGAEINYGVNSYAARSGNLDVLKYFADEKDSKIGEYVVDDAVQSGNLDMVKYLVGEKNANISNDSLQTAIKRGYLDIVKYLVEKGEKVDYYDITTATHYDRRDIVDYLKSVIEIE